MVNLKRNLVLESFFRAVFTTWSALDIVGNPVAYGLSIGAEAVQVLAADGLR